MKKRILAIVTAAVLALGCASTAFAKLEHSPSADDMKKWTVVAAVDGGFTLKGKNYTLYDFDASVDGENVLDANKVAWSHLISQTGLSKAKIKAVLNIKCDEADEDDPAEIIIPYDKAKAGQSYTIWHYTPKDKIWDNTSILVSKVENGKIYCKVKKTSPIAIVAGGSSAADPAKGSTTPATNGKAAPKTGEV